VLGGSGFFVLMMRRPPKATPLYSSAASDVYKRQVQNMVDHDWLDQYDDLEGMRDVMRRLDRRAQGDSGFEKGLNDMHKLYEELLEPFTHFMGDVRKRASDYVQNI